MKRNGQPKAYRVPDVAPCCVCEKLRVAMVAFQCVDGSTVWYCARCYVSETG